MLGVRVNTKCREVRMGRLGMYKRDEDENVYLRQRTYSCCLYFVDLGPGTINVGVRTGESKVSCKLSTRNGNATL